MSLNRSRMTRRDVLRLMGMSAAGTALAACVPAAPGGGGAAAPSSSGAAAGEAATETTVRFWNVWGAAREELMNQIAAGFAEEYPGVTVENLVQPFENRAENLFAAIASSQPPEVLMASRAEILQMADEGLILPITSYVESAGIDLNNFYDSEIGNFYYKGELYSMPMPTGGGVTSLMLVNSDMFAAAGQDVVVPTTWQELEEVAKEFTVLDDRGIVTIGANVGTAVADFFAWLYCNNGQIYSDDLRSVAFNSEVGMETLNWMVNFTNDINGGVQNVTDFFAGPGEATEAQPWYNDSQLINFPNVSIFFHIQTYRPDLGFEVGLRPFNANNADAKSQGLSGEAFAWGYVVPKAVPRRSRKRRSTGSRRLPTTPTAVAGSCSSKDVPRRSKPVTKIRATTTPTPTGPRY
ncbi:MAG: extracellular solute-binding protein [Caldilineaceae bacterium]